MYAYLHLLVYLLFGSGGEKGKRVWNTTHKHYATSELEELSQWNIKVGSYFGTHTLFQDSSIKKKFSVTLKHFQSNLLG